MNSFQQHLEEQVEKFNAVVTPLIYERPNTAEDAFDNAEKAKDLLRQSNKETVKWVIGVMRRFWHENHGMDEKGREFIYRKQFDDLISEFNKVI